VSDLILRALQKYKGEGVVAALYIIALGQLGVASSVKCCFG
jgi:hypothetical protein